MQDIRLKREEKWGQGDWPESRRSDWVWKLVNAAYPEMKQKVLKNLIVVTVSSLSPKECIEKRVYYTKSFASIYQPISKFLTNKYINCADTNK